MIYRLVLIPGSLRRSTLAHGCTTETKKDEMFSYNFHSGICKMNLSGVLNYCSPFSSCVWKYKSRPIIFLFEDFEMENWRRINILLQIGLERMKPCGASNFAYKNIMEVNFIKLFSSWLCSIILPNPKWKPFLCCFKRNKQKWISISGSIDETFSGE